VTVILWLMGILAIIGGLIMAWLHGRAQGHVEAEAETSLARGRAEAARARAAAVRGDDQAVQDALGKATERAKRETGQ
jgi:hypothetical protein